ncbi:MAG: hypothetical protein WBE32_17370 [Pseudolabrys sp.]
MMAFMLALIAAPARSFEAATADDTARFLAGLPLSSNSPLAPYTKDPGWQQHARYFDTIFAHEISAQLSKVREFSKKYLTDQHDTMLYMFSGPDFLYATSQAIREVAWNAANYPQKCPVKRGSREQKSPPMRLNPA